MHDTFSDIKDILALINMLLVMLIIPGIKYIKTSMNASIELQKTIKELKDEIHLLQNILFDVADGETIKRHMRDKSARDT